MFFLKEDDLRVTAAHGLAKLLIYNRILSSYILSRLLLIWFNPISEDNPILRRLLACFFTDYACGDNDSKIELEGSVTYEHQSSLCSAVLVTLTSLIRAPASNPLSEVEPTEVASLLVRLTDTTHLKSQEIFSNQNELDDNGKKTSQSMKKPMEFKKVVSLIFVWVCSIYNFLILNQVDGFKYNLQVES